MGINGKICMPITTPHVKVQATRAFGGTVVQYGESFAETLQYALNLAHEEGRTFVHAFNDSNIIAGQGTLAIELLEQNPFLEAIVVPVGGGGLIAGVSLFIKQINPRIKVYGVESDAMPGMFQSMKAGHVVSVPKKPTFSDGIAIETVGMLPFKYIKEYVDKIVLVDEDESAAAVLALMETEKTICEGSGAAAVAAMMFNKLPELHGKQVACMVTGSNIDMTLIGRIIDKGLFKSGRLARIHVSCLDVPGELARVLSVIKDCRANVRDVMHERAFLVHNVGITQPSIVLETRSFEHIQEVVDALLANGFEDVFVDSPSSVPSPRRAAKRKDDDTGVIRT
jgi:threonine dehydratase